MAMFSLCTETIAVLVACVVGLITYFKWVFKYWEKRSVPYVQPSIPFGTLENQLMPKASFAMSIRQHYEESKRKGLKHIGLFAFTRPMYMPIDLEYIKHIFSSDFNHFVDRGVYYNEKDDPISAHLFALEGARWKALRAKMTPTFTSGKMKRMFPLLIGCGKQMTEAIVENGTTAFEIKDWLGRFTTDVIGTCAFGIDCNSFKEPNSQFRIYGKRVITPTLWESIKIFVTFANVGLARTLGIRTTNTDVANFFLNVVKDVVDEREKNKTVRNDFLQILLELKNSVDEKEKLHLTINELAAEAFVFFIAGFETSSTTGAFCLYELARNQEIQDRVREEVVKVMEAHDGELTYEGVKEMTYLNQIIDETLRMYAPLSHLTRVCTMDYKIPGTNVTIEKGTSVVLSVGGLHYDPEYHPNPETFDPDRFSKENRKNIRPYSYIPFGEGPRMCIGLRFGIMQLGVGLALLLKDFRFTVSEKTEVPLKMNPYTLFTSVVGDIWLNVEKI